MHVSNPTRNAHGQSGSTLIEVAVAMATVAILSFSVMLGFSTASTQDRQAREIAQLQDGAVAALEFWESLPHDVLIGLAGFTFAIPPTGQVQVTVTVTEVSNDLISLEAVAVDASTGRNPVRLVTLKTRKEEVSLQ